MAKESDSRKLIAAIATLNGTIMGAGFLGIPYVVAKAGFPVGLAYIVFIGLMLLVVNLSLGEISLRTKGTHQLTGYAEKYLGKKGKFIMFLATIFGIYSALLAYLIGEGESLSILIFSSPQYSFYLALAFFALLAAISYIGLRALKKGESVALFIILGIIAVIAVYFSKNISLANLSYINTSNLFLPFGVILFSFLGFSAMPELERLLQGREKLMKKAIIYGSVIPIIAYSLFALIVVGYAGLQTNEIATLSLGRAFIILGILTMFTASLSLSIALRDMYRFDFKIKRTIAWLLAILIPLILFLLIQSYKLASFTQILDIGGTISGGISGILILLMVQRAKAHGNRKPEYSMPRLLLLKIIIAVIFLLGMIKLVV